MVATGSLPVVLRRSLTLLLPVALAFVAAGCSTFSDNDAVARVGDVELSQDDFEQQLVDLGVTDGDVVPLDPVRGEITRWIQDQLVDDSMIAELYGAGPSTSGVVCIAAIVVEDETIADDAVAQLDGGASFDEVYAAVNIDPTLDADGGALPCIGSADLDASAGIPLIDTATQLSDAAPNAVAPLLDDAGSPLAFAVISFRPFDELTETDLADVAASMDVSDQLVDADVYVDPRYGTFDTETAQVVGLS